MHGLRAEFQDRVNFVILDVDDPAEGSLARLLGYSGTPAYLLIEPDSAEVIARIFGPQRDPVLREILASFAVRYGG